MPLSDAELDAWIQHTQRLEADRDFYRDWLNKMLFRDPPTFWRRLVFLFTGRGLYDKN